MGKLKSLTPSLQPLGSRLSYGRDREGHSRTAEPWRSWYNTAAWQSLRQQVFARDLYTCQEVGCGVLIQNPRHRIGDHIRSVRSAFLRGGLDAARRAFFDPSNVQTLCKTCHDTRKQAEEAAQRRGGG